MDVLFDIPVLGFVFQFLGYLIDAIFTTNLPAQTLQLATPIALGALCGVMNERSGIVNIGIEGMMLTCAFVGFMAGVIVSDAMPGVEARRSSASRRRSSSAWSPRSSPGCSCRCCTHGCRSPCGPTRSSAAR